MAPVVWGLCATLGLGAACAPLPLFGEEEPPRQKLTLVGDRHVYLESGARTELRVRYHDADGMPLFGAVEFSVRGDAKGASLSVPEVTTDASGMASVALDANVTGQASFEVEASAVDAGPVIWSVTVEGPRVPLDPAGRYRIDSSFDVVSGLHEGALSDVLHGVLELSRDPGSAVLAMAAELGWIPDEQAASLGSDLTEFLAAKEPELAERLRVFGAQFAEVSRELGVVSTMTVSSDGTSGEHMLSDLVVTLADRRYPFTLAELGFESATSADRMAVSVSDDQDRLFIEEHALAVPYGAMVKVVLEELLPGVLDDGANDFSSFLLTHIPCEAIAGWMDHHFDLGTTSGFSACHASVTTAAAEIVSLTETLDEAGFELVIGGEARAVDTTGDGKPEVLLDGAWQGSFEHGGLGVSRLDAAHSPFRAERLGE